MYHPDYRHHIPSTLGDSLSSCSGLNQHYASPIDIQNQFHFTADSWSALCKNNQPEDFSKSDPLKEMEGKFYFPSVTTLIFGENFPSGVSLINYLPFTTFL